MLKGHAVSSLSCLVFTGLIFINFPVGKMRPVGIKAVVCDEFQLSSLFCPNAKAPDTTGYVL